MKKNSVLWFLIWTWIVGILIAFYHINEKNYLQQKIIQNDIVNHPEKLPSSRAAALSSFGFTHMAADMYWLRAVNYIGTNVVQWEYKKYLSAMMNLITDLDPYFESPYVIGQLLLPSSAKSYEEFTWDEVVKNIKQGEALWLKWIKNFCDTAKLEAIRNEDNLNSIIQDEKYSNPCNSYKIPFNLAYIYYFYLKDNSEASEYYKVVSAQKDAPTGWRVLAAIMQWKWWEREKSIYMFLSLAENTSSEWESCSVLTQELQKAYNYISVQKLPLTWEFIKNIELLTSQVLPKLSDENESTILADTECTNFLAKAVRELNLLYLEQADQKYAFDNPDKISAYTPEELFSRWYIDFIPTDYQQYEDEDYGIIYRYSEDTRKFDYEMWY